MPVEQRPGLDIRHTTSLVVVCLCAGIAPLAARSIPDDVARIACGVVITVLFLGFALFAKAHSALRKYWEVSFAFCVFALVQVLNNSIPGYVGASILHDPPNSGNPLASTVSGTVSIQLLGTLIAIVPVIGLTMASGKDPGTIYARSGGVSKWFAFALVFFVFMYFFAGTILLRPGSSAQRLFPMNGSMTLDRFVGLSPALIVAVILNGFQEEFLFRGLFLQKYDELFGPYVSNGLQATVFGVAHAGVTYTPSAFIFIIAVVFPLGLLAGYFMRRTNGVIAPAMFHAGLDIPIYLAFLSAAS